MNPRYPTSKRYRRHRKRSSSGLAGMLRLKWVLLILVAWGGWYLFGADGGPTEEGGSGHSVVKIDPVSPAIDPTSADSESPVEIELTPPVIPEPQAVPVRVPRAEPLPHQPSEPPEMIGFGSDRIVENEPEIIEPQEPPIPAEILREIQVITEGQRPNRKGGEAGFGRGGRERVVLQFYRELPKRRVILPPEADPEKSLMRAEAQRTDHAETRIRDLSRQARQEEAMRDDGFIVQLAHFPAKRHAVHQAGKLYMEGARDIRVVQAHRDGRDLFLLQVGPYPTRVDAARAALRWRMEDKPAVIVWSNSP
ncbi:MAG: SPOR domain-containing protein [Magnetococcales bacterium]|nr:SPOR domain-containing protein [Magnetococcales bacterium]